MNRNMIEDITQYTKSLRTLLIEDDYDSRTQTLKMFENLFNKIETASDGIKGLEKFENGKFDIIFSDINMPNMDGIGFIKKIRQKDKNIPIVIISAYDNKPYMLKCIEEGIDGYIIKPIEIKKFLKVLKKIVDKMNSSNIQKFVFLNGDFCWNSTTKRLSNGNDITLTPNEVRFLDFLILAKGAVKSNIDIDLYLFDDAVYNDRRIRNLISRLRKKIGYEFLESVYGEGYRVKILP